MADTKLSPELQELFDLAKDDPAEFERRTQAMKKEVIESATGQTRKKLRSMQWRIDVERQRFKGEPIFFASYIFGTMWSRFTDLNFALQGFRQTTTSLQQGIATLPPPRQLILLVDNEKTEKE